ncbi:unnamed protein product [Brugia pahangi]|uniref:Uncharacterized protein n=1 Tax=Brugia pahangi TaxID=6280 RepID=A0A0N4T789_BRUPA|nr:unnamed protein product [Brugia pahangi]VDN85226.1 unnamed protein product [Brugia pahangi]
MITMIKKHIVKRMKLMALFLIEQLSFLHDMISCQQNMDMVEWNEDVMKCQL